MSNKFVDLTGQKFSRLTVLSRYEKNKIGYAQWLCKCDCGNTKIVRTDLLKSGAVRSCGCIAREISSKRCRELGLSRATHNKSHTRLYKIYSNMKDRCNRVKCPAYKNYGVRGIKVCSEWENDFNKFYEWSINNGYDDKLTIDRIDNNKGYSSDNCRWVDRKTQCLNTRYNIYITYNDKTRTLKEWADELSLPYLKIWKRLHRGWSFERAIEK